MAFTDINNIEINGDIDLIKAVILRMKPEYGFDLFLRSDIPPNTGLGSSGAVAVATIGVFNHCRSENKLKRHEIAELAFKIENEDLSNVGGRQDQYAATFGGMNYMEFWKDDFVKIVPVNVSMDYILELEKHLVLTFVSKRGPSGEVQAIMVDQQIKDTRDSFGNNIKILDALKEHCKKMYQALSKGELDRFGYLLHESWQMKRELSNRITNAKIDKIYENTIKAGALGGKITGAGGGGCMIFFSKSNLEINVTDKLIECNTRVIDFSFDNTGLVTWEIQKKNRQVEYKMGF